MIWKSKKLPSGFKANGMATSLLLVFLFLVLWSVVIAHATGPEGEPFPNEGDLRHILRVLVAFCAGAFALILPWKSFERWAYRLYLITIVGLLAVLFFAPPIRATRRWLCLGPLRFQVSEAVKITLTLALAKYLKIRDPRKPKTIFGATALLLIPAFLIALEPDLGTAVLLFPVFFALLLCRGVPVKFLGLVLMGALSLGPWIYQYGLAPYQKRRLMGFISPEAARIDPDSVLQRQRALQAIGTGGLFGKGLGNGDRTVPERSTDFAFAVVAEETGFLGALSLLILYWAYVSISFSIALSTFDHFARLVALGVALSFGTQALVNMAMATGLLPITGLNLPLVSQGGSSLIATAVQTALLVNIALRRPRTLARKIRIVSAEGVESRAF